MLNRIDSQSGSRTDEIPASIPVEGVADQLSLPDIQDGIVRITPEQAALILELIPYPHQNRHKNAAGRQHISVLADIMKRGKWREKEKLDFADLNGRKVLINGHHRLSAQVVADKTIDWMVAVHPRQTGREVAELFYTFDTNIRHRTNQTILGGAEMEKQLGVSKTTAEALYRATPLLISGFSFSRNAQDTIANRVVDRRMDVMREYQREIALWEASVSKAPSEVKRRLSNQGALAVALICFRHQETEAVNFWKGVANNDKLARNDPRGVYLNKLQRPTHTTTAEYTARLAASGWNAWVSGRMPGYFKPNDSKIFRIAGTPVGA